MTKKKKKEFREIYATDLAIKKKEEGIRGPRAKVESKSKIDYGSGRGTGKNNDNISERRKFSEIERLENQVLKCIIGQDKQVRQIITAIYRSINFQTIKSNVLIIGNSGTGKTETIIQIAKRLDIPYTIEDATKYTKEGYYGADVNEMVYNLLENADYNFERAEKGIIVIDEIDKKAGHEEYDVSGVEVLKSLLKMIEGTTVRVQMPYASYGEEPVNFYTKDLIIIFLGAFSGLDKIRDKRLNANPMGFVSCKAKQDKHENRFLKKDLVEYGMPEEFVGRVDTIIEMNKLTKQDLATILRKSKLSIFRRYQAELKEKGVTLYYSPEIFNLIAEESLALDTGARELSNTVNYIFENITHDILANPNQYTKCKLSLEIVKDNTQYELS